MRWKGPGGLVLAGHGSCARIEYVLVGEVLERRASDACGGTRVVAAPVRRIARSGRRLEVAFSHRAGRDDERDTRFVAFLLAEETP